MALANPLDYHTYIWGNADKMAQTFISIMQGKNIDIGIIIVDFPRPDLCDPAAGTVLWKPQWLQKSNQKTRCFAVHAC